MTQKVTIHDVAQQAQVSVGSVSRALNNYPHVSEELKSRVMAAALELDYEPAFLANGLRRGQTSSVGFLVGTIANPVISTIFEAASEALSAKGYAVTLVSSRNQAELDVACLRLLARRQVSGLIVSSAAESPEPARRYLGELGIPTVMLDREATSDELIYAVQSDHESSMREAVAHLIRRGHRAIAFIGGPEDFYPTRRRFLAYQAALLDADLPQHPELIRFTSFNERAAYAEALLLLQSRPLPSALIVAGNIILAGALMALQDLGLIVGRDIALVACDDINLTRLYRPPITAIRRDLKLLGVTAARLLLRGMTSQNSEIERIIKLPTELVLRESTQYARTLPRSAPAARKEGAIGTILN